MPLSDHEQKLLAQMEQALYAEDPKFATSMTGRRRGGRSTMRVTVGVVALIVGLVVLVLGLGLLRGQLTAQILAGVGGFVIMFAGAILAVTSGSAKKPGLTAVDANGKPVPRPKPRRASFLQRMEERWDRRRDNGWQ